MASPINFRYDALIWAVAQLEERLPCKQEVVGSTPISSTI